MAGRWRIRHKLLLGLGLVVAIIALMLCGTVIGLWSYRTTTHIIRSKHEELVKAHNLRDAVKALAAPAANLATEAIDLTANLDRARAALDLYREQLRRTVEEGHTLDDGYTEQAYVRIIGEDLGKLDAELARLLKDYAPETTQGTRAPLLARPDVRAAVDKLVTDSDDLTTVIYRSLTRRMEMSKRDYKISFGVVLFISVGGVLLLASLLRGFYCWVAGPIHDLQRGAGQIARGDFDHVIDVKSGDELEELAAAFNHMTDRLREFYNDLSRQVNERSRQLVRSERLASVGFLAAGVAHEINNPLASIAFCSESLENRLQDVFAATSLMPGSTVTEGDKATITRYLDMIQQEAFRCKEITQKLLEFSRGGERRREPADLGEIIRSVLEVVQHLQNCKGKHLAYDPPGPLTAWVNAQEIKSVVLNLVVNALESMDEGGTLTITQRRNKGMAELVFHDTGCGMTPEVLDNIFEPFFTRSRTGKGTGLGLSICHRIISHHGGEIEAASPGPDLGSTFVIRLPTTGAAEGAGAPAADDRRDYLDSYEGQNRRAA